jgi:4-alpha-glucanotransferase
MIFERASGILLHPTCLPGPYGIGDIGPEAYHWVDFLTQAGCSLWQILPLGPTGYGDSPYQCSSAFAGNPYLINPDLLLTDGLLHPDDLADRPNFNNGSVEYGMVIPWKLNLLNQAFRFFQDSSSPTLKTEFEAFKFTESSWLDDFALFMAIKESHGGAPWPTWKPALRQHQPQALRKVRQVYDEAIQRQIFRQFIFWRQWNALHDYANKRGIKIIGDISIFVAHDSAEVWAKSELFYMDKEGNPTVVAGVPPDYFSAKGQLWGNPLYRWDIHAKTTYAWWLERIRSMLKMVDIIRLDHFRGFDAYWEVPAGETTAVNGHWVPGPGSDFFEAIQKALGSLPIIAEDLGIITPSVNKLREQFDLPGMKVLVFAFNSGPTNPYLPHNYELRCVAYTGTHDNDTTRGWYEQTGEDERKFTNRYLNIDGRDISWDLLRAAWSSVAVFAIAPLQDILGLGNDARMNYPSSLGNNWKWRLTPNTLTNDLISRLAEINYLYRRTRI